MFINSESQIFKDWKNINFNKVFKKEDNRANGWPIIFKEWNYDFTNLSGE